MFVKSALSKPRPEVKKHPRPLTPPSTPPKYSKKAEEDK